MRMQESACTPSFLHAHAGTILRMHSEFQKLNTASFYINVEVWNESHIVYELF